jgi:2-hydroxychromene-2-carboxylate isomerase
MAELECFIDCSSPWTYFAFESLLRMQDEIGVTIQWRPFLVGGVFNAVNQSV